MSFDKNPILFTHALADILRIPDETLALTFIYIDLFTSTVPPSCPLDDHTLSLSALSLACKTHSFPRSPASILLPAHTLLHSAPAPSTDSEVYSSLRRTLIRGETMLERALGYDHLRSSPLDYIPRYMSNALRDHVNAAEDFNRYDGEERARRGVVEERETRAERRAREIGIVGCRTGLVRRRGAKLVAAAAISFALSDMGFAMDERIRKGILKDRIGLQEWKDCLDELKKNRTDGT